MEKEVIQQSSCCSVKRSNLLERNEEYSKQETIQIAKEVKFKEKMIYLSGGDFFMGTNDREGSPTDGEGPARKVTVDPFYIDSHTVTNAEFQQFVQETGYQTEAEKFGWSFVFYQFISKEMHKHLQKVPGTPWWLVVEGANWYKPEGPGSTIENRLDHPVIQVSWNDAMAFCEWAGKRLPTEAEWEFAARGGLEQKKYAWGDELNPNGKHYCNIWQGSFPYENTEEDGYHGTAPAQSFPPNGYGLYNVAGNVWEWCSDWFTSHPERLIDSASIHSQTPKSMRGGSYLCHHSYCNRYRVAARSSNTMDSATGNIGFRCVSDVER
ncbi:formylglycine-generating enzyme family protein [Psychrobacillus sp.]|uniref:formylglycine-generating enzyme family protein n=1 Tax=Psychrobacillus sp. TaxID=1871623 RepID=UPI0028BEE5C3|nr:formylglycine-generating enzyme family protein [Psychrobacillus sp.]